MKIEITVESNAHFRFDKPTINFPFVLIFMDRTDNTLVEVNLDLDAFLNLYKEISEKIDVPSLQKQIINLKKTEVTPNSS